MDRPRPLRVLIMGQQDSLNNILAANIRHRGYEAVLLPMESIPAAGEVYGDVLLYDMDEAFRLAKSSLKKRAAFQMLPPVEGREEERPGLWPYARFTIVMSSRSVSREQLEELGAVALLMKPFGIERLQRYLAVLWRLLQEEHHTIEGVAEGPPRVLIVDDDIDVARAIHLCLKDVTDYELAVAYDGLEALERYVEWRPHCIVTDLIMPWMNGYQMIRCLDRSPLPALPAFVVMSALTSWQVASKRPDLRGKAVIYVEKPFFVEHLHAAIEQALQKLASATRPLA
jgi:CheY-like chemotaxis protein